jgi:regulator of sigma E protease
MNFLQTVLAFLCALGPLIIFHELGHYTLARLCGVKVLRFSVGMGKVVWSRRFGPDQTEWAVSALPLGGYVKMLDGREDDLSGLSEQEKRREFTAQGVWRRIAIVAAGPLANFLLAILLLAGLSMAGRPEPASRIRFMPENTPAYMAGLRGGDLVTAVNGEPVQTWAELRWQIIHAAVDQRDARIEVERLGRGRQDATVPAAALAGLDVEGDLLGKLGIAMARPKTVLGKAAEGGPAARAGLASGDQVLAIDGKPVADVLAFVETVRAAAGKTVTLDVLRGQRSLAIPVTIESDPATKTGRMRVELLNTTEMATISYGPFAALAKGARKTWETSALTVKMIGRMITGEVSWKNVTGPITIADYAGQSARIGIATYLEFIAFISISLGVMNLLPIPVLDGGLLLYYSLEVLTGRPLPERVGEFAQRFGVGLLVVLMAIAVFNDVARLL